MTVDPGKVMLEHYGVLGMRWGVRKQDDGSKAKTGSSQDDSTGYKPKSPGTTRGEERKARRAAKKQAKAVRDAPNSKYGHGARVDDRVQFGKGGVKRINRRMNQGDSRKTARTKELRRATTKTVAGAAAGYALMRFGPEIADMSIKAIANLDSKAADAAQRRRAKAGADAARNLFADNKGLTNYRTIRMEYDSVADIWK